MKNVHILTLIIVLLGSDVFAQWNLNGNAAYYNAGNVGIGLIDPIYPLQINSADNPTLSIGKLNANTNGKSTLKFFAGDATYKNGFLVQYLKDGTTDRLGFVGGSGLELLSIFNNGNIGIGTLTPDLKLTVNGKIKCEEVQVVVDVPADYVFSSEYKLMSLQDLAKYIRENKHLPNVPSAEELKQNGWQVGEMNNKLLEKVEELTLYLLEMKKENEELKSRLEKLECK